VPRVRLTTILLVPIVLQLGARALAAQTFEVGGSIAVSCIGSDGSICSEGNLLTAGPSASVWFADWVEVGARVVWFELNDLSRTLRGPTTIDTEVTARERRIFQGEVIWHFRREKRIRPLFGVGVGRYWRSQVATCSPPGCEATLGPGFPAGRTNDSTSDVSVVTGLSVLLNPRVRVRGGWRYHNPFKDELAVSEYFLALGYRIGRG
jgi:outer membrane protein with beta-barrel domain